jgi:hypothetical protein
MPGDAQRFPFVHHDWRRMDLSTSIVSVLAAVGVVVVLLYSGTYLVFAFLPLAVLLLVVWYAYWGFLTARRMETDRFGLSIVYRLRRVRIPWDRVAAWSRVDNDILTDGYAGRPSVYQVRHALEDHYVDVLFFARRMGPMQMLLVHRRLGVNRLFLKLDSQPAKMGSIRPHLWVFGVSEPERLDEQLHKHLGEPVSPAKLKEMAGR